MGNIKNVSIRIPIEVHRKLSYISDYEVRSMNSMVIYLIRRYIAKFENEYGKIEIEE